MRWIIIAATALLLAGCDPKALPPSSIAPICAALIGPIHYNSSSPMSKRYAAYLLALDIHQRNEVGVRLGCPQYK